MTVKATISFAGAISMSQGEIRDITNNSEVLSDLIDCGYVEPVEHKKVKTNENKRINK